jgi:putative hydrolase of the HAD superfamily
VTLPTSRTTKAVLFDAGATLVHPDPPVEAVYAREFAADGARFGREDFARALTRAWEEVHAGRDINRYGGVRGEIDFWRAFLNRVRSFLDGGTVSPEAFDRLAIHFRSASAWTVYDDVVATLEDLSRRGFALGIVSNWDSYLPKLLEALDLAKFFRVVAVSAIEETGKPDAEIFHRACRRLGVDPREALHVGDSVAEDFDGARAAGLSALLLDRDDRHPEIADRIRTLAHVAERVSMP